MSYYKVCPYCGCNLDPGEVCDCREWRDENWIGKDFRDWCIANGKARDDRMIYCTLITRQGSKVTREEFTSNDEIEFSTWGKIRQSKILDMKLVDNEWHCKIEYRGLL